MITFILIVFLMGGTAVAVYIHLKKYADARIAQAYLEMEQMRQECLQEVSDAREQSRHEIATLKTETYASAEITNRLLEQKLAELEATAADVRAHYEAEAVRVYSELHDDLQAAYAELEPLRQYAGLTDAEEDVRQKLAIALQEADLLRQQADTLLEQTRLAGAQDRAAAQQKARAVREQAALALRDAAHTAAELVAKAELNAQQIAKDAYVALRDQRTLEAAVGALWNVVNGFGERYVVPTRSLLDNLAADFGHTEAGRRLKIAREQTRHMVELGLAATCNYDETDRRQRANRFVADAFNGRVDAILSRTKHDNYGTLAQEIKDAFSIVNLNGLAFRDARVLQAYLDARLDELKWAVTTQELRAQEREQQRALQEQMREEEKGRREYERALEESAREQAIIHEAMERARSEAAAATAEERERWESEFALLGQRLAEAEAKGQRALSLAQQTRAGNVYIISNVGSFGEGVIKIGMTRRLVPEDRVRELGDASVPFSFDVHAMIRSDDAPTLERMLHTEFGDARVNKVNLRKEFFRLPIERVRQFTHDRGLDITFTLSAEAREYRETAALEKLSPEERARFLQQQEWAEEHAIDTNLPDEQEE